MALVLAVAGGAAWWFLRKRAETQRARASRSAFEAQQRLAAQRDQMAQTVSRADFERLAAQVQQNTEALQRLTERARTPETPPAPAPPPVALAVQMPPADLAATAFTDWCRQGSPMMSRVEFFKTALQQAVAGAAVRAVYRDLNSQAEPIRFDDRGGASPAEFWLVTAGADTLLFPQPLNGNQFRDLTRVFEGTAAPRAVGHVAPARVRDDGTGYALTAPGRVS